MRKMQICLLFSVFLVLFGCVPSDGGETAQTGADRFIQRQALSAGFSARISFRLTYPRGSEEYICRVTSHKNGDGEIALLEPERMRAFSIASAKGKVAVCFEDEPYDDGGGLMGMPVSIPDYLWNGVYVLEGQTGEASAEGIVFKKSAGDAQITLTADPESEKPLYMQIASKDIGCEVTFLQFDYLYNDDVEKEKNNG